MSKINQAWKLIFEKLQILYSIEEKGFFEIKASEIKLISGEEPRLMAKFDSSASLPDIFSKNELSILPISRNKYIISNFEAYKKFESINSSIKTGYSLSNIQSIDIKNINSEAISINCAFASGILEDFLDDDELYPTVSGRMGTGSFYFNVNKKNGGFLNNILVESSQMEIDAAFEGINSLSLIEAKKYLSEDFLIRQLYYPYHFWQKKITKRVRSIFLTYSNSIFNLYEYEFKEPSLYNSLKLVKHQNYLIEDSPITMEDLINVYSKIYFIGELAATFPQADKFERIINLCELLKDKSLHRDEITNEYAFDNRQTSYYTSAGIYLGLIERNLISHGNFSLTSFGREVLSLSYKERQLKLFEAIIRHKVFYDVFTFVIKNGYIPDTKYVVNTMRKYQLVGVCSDETRRRRSSTIKSWISWGIKLIRE